MSAETVTNKIEEKAHLSAEAIIKDAKAKAEADRALILEDAKLRADKMIEKAKINAEITEKGRAQSDAMNTKLEVLSLKRELLLKAKDEAKEKLLKTIDKNFVDVFKKYVLDSELSGEYELIPSPLHRELCTKSIADIEKACGIKLTLSDKNADIDSGFIVSCENYDVVFSLNDILDEVFEKNEKIISIQLFETGDAK